MNEKTTMVQIVMPQDCNAHPVPRLFGGRLMAWIDVTGAVAARRWSRKNVTTASVEHLDFLAAAHLGDTVVQEAAVTWTGRTSMEVRVDTYVEHMDGSRTPVNRAYLVYVALDEDDRPTPVPVFTPETEEEKREWEAARERKARRSAR